MGDCKTSCVNGGIIVDWCRSFREFTGLLRKPAAPPRNGLHQTEALSKWIVCSTQADIVRYLVFSVLAFVTSFLIPTPSVPVTAEGEEPTEEAETAMMATMALVTMVMHAISGVVSLFMTWINSSVLWWVCRREPSTLCCCMFYIEGWKHTHLLYGIVRLLRCLYSAEALMAHGRELFLVDVLGAMGYFYVAVRVVLTIFVEITVYFVAISLVKVGMKKSGYMDYGIEKSEYGSETVGQPVASTEIKTGEIKINLSTP
jgi:hypothetical protein